MIRKTLCGLALALAVVVGARAEDEPKKDTHEGLLKETIKALNDMSEVLEGVKDEATAKAAKPKLEKVTKKMKDLKKRADKLGKPGEAEEKKLKEKYEPQIKKATKRLGEAAAKVVKVPGGTELLKTLQNLRD